MLMFVIDDAGDELLASGQVGTASSMNNNNTPREVKVQPLTFAQLYKLVVEPGEVKAVDLEVIQHGM